MNKHFFIGCLGNIYNKATSSGIKASAVKITAK
jgi:hypothetical protein